MWFSLYMLLIQFVDMHLLFLFSFFWLLLSFFFNQPFLTQCDERSVWSRGRKKKHAIFLLFRPLKKYLATIWMGFVPTQKTSNKKQTEATIRTKRPLTPESQPQEFFKPLSAAVAFVCMTHVWDSWERPGPSGASPPLSSLLPPPFSRLPIPPPPAAWWEGWAPPRWYTQPPVVSPQVTGVNWQRLPCEEKNTTRQIFFPSLLPPKTQKRQLKLSLFTLPVKYYWSFM